jgi:putative glutamine amidotransferase
LNVSRPLIGITTYLERTQFGGWDVEAAVLYRGYFDSVVLAGGNAVLLPPVGDWNADSVSFLDGIVIAGGADVDPARYGQERGPLTGPSRPDRDASELALVAAAMKLDLPLLAVCRGAQLLNVALGGTLHQHIEGHDPKPGPFVPKEITTEPGSRVAGILGEGTTVQCRHHQALDRIGEGLHVTARAADGVVEAVELDGARFAVGIQSHPEQNIEDLRLFSALLAATRSTSV